MIGRHHSTQDRGRAGRWIVRVFRAASLVAVAAWILAVSDARAQRPGKLAPAAPREQPTPLPDMGEPAPQPAPGGLAFPPEGEKAPALDPRVVPVAGDETNPDPPAKERPGGLRAVKGTGGDPDPFALPSTSLTPGKHRVQLTVDVQAKEVINIGKETTVRIVVFNEGNVDAYGISVVYTLPEGIDYVSSTPDATQVPGEKSDYYFRKSMLGANGEWAIVLKVVARQARQVEHLATVTAKAGSKAVAIVQEPKLKVEASAAPGRVLKGNQVSYQITVSNPGTGPARGVTVQAKLSGGLKLGSDDIVEQTIDVIAPGGRVALDPLIVDAVAGGQQTCTVEVRSPDVNHAAEEHRVIRPVDVTEPRLALKLSGQDFRYTGQTNEYKLTVTNPGTAPARRVKVSASLPSQGGRLKPGPLPAGAEFDKKSRKLLWMIPQLEPGQSAEFTFVYETSTPGLYQCAAEATAGELRMSDKLSTEVSGIAALDIRIKQANRYLDVGKSNYYEITIKNEGTKEATRLQLSGNLTKNLKVDAHYGVDRGDFNYQPATGNFVFPEIERLDPGKTLVLGLDATAVESGSATCHVNLAHDDTKIEDVISTMITGNGRPRPVPAAARPGP